jgi:hypothetical protein
MGMLTRNHLRGFEEAARVEAENARGGNQNNLQRFLNKLKLNPFNDKKGVKGKEIALLASKIN